MSTANDLNQSLDNQDKYDDEILGNIKKLNEKVPFFEERKKERDAKRFLLNNSPPDLIDEIAPNLLQIEKSDEKILANSLPVVENAVAHVLHAVNSSTGTASPYVSEVSRFIDISPLPDPQLQLILKPFDELAEYKLQKKTIPENLDKIHQGLGDMFIEAVSMVESAKSGIGNQSKSIMAMRDVYQSIWANLIDGARQAKPKLWQGVQRNRFSQTDTRELVAKSLGKDTTRERKLILALEAMYELFSEMSSNQIGKDLLFHDLIKLKKIFTKWILQLDDLVSILSL